MVTWMNLEIIMLSGMPQTQKDRHCLFSPCVVWSVSSWTQRVEQWLTALRVGGNGKLLVKGDTFFSFKMDTFWNLTYSMLTILDNIVLYALIC